MMQNKNRASQNSPDSEAFGGSVAEKGPRNLVKLDDFAVQNSKAKSDSGIQSVIKYLVRETNKQKLEYLQLKYIFKVVRERCEVEVPSQKQKLYELPTKEELGRFYSHVDNPVHKLIFKTLEGTGLRVSELCSLQLKYVDFENNLIHVKNGKGGKDRVTVIGEKLKDNLLLHLKGKSHKFLFESARNTKFSTRRIQQIHERYRRIAGIEKKFTLHSFRHIWNTRLAEAGVSREHREILAGHSKGSKAQDIYTHLGVGGIKEKVLEVVDA